MAYYIKSFGKNWKNIEKIGILGGLGSLGGMAYIINNAELEQAVKVGGCIYQKPDARPKYINRNEIERHNKIDDFWVTYKDGVYDITNFVQGHPGGLDKIKMAAGGPVDDYWSLYSQHKTRRVLNLLEKYRIGSWEPDEESDVNNNYSPYIDEPERDGGLLIHSVEPFNAETPLHLLVNNYLTPNRYWYVRNHHPTPNINRDTYKLEITLGNKVTKKITLNDLEKYPKHNVTTTIQCAGNRRDEYNNIRPVQGTKWKGGAISTATWQGYYLRDILLDLGVTDDDLESKYLTAWGDDGDYRISIPLKKALLSENEVLLAVYMNDETLPRDHGYPIRLIVPGSVGTKQVKWLSNLEITDQPCKSSWQSGIAYKMLPSDITDFSQVSSKLLELTPTIDIPPLQSIICDIIQDNNSDSIKVKGIAWSGGGKNIIRVEVSYDGGNTWHIANLGKGSEQLLGKAWAWTHWELDIPNDKISREGATTITCRACDISYNRQPENLRSIWNIRGLLNNNWHKVNINGSQG